MDFPIQLKYNSFESVEDSSSVRPGIGSNLEFTYGYEELKQDIYLLLKTINGSFLQDPKLGTLAVPHTVEQDYLFSMVSRCVEQINGVTCNSVSLVNDRIYLSVTYKNGVVNFDYSVTSL